MVYACDNNKRSTAWRQQLILQKEFPECRETNRQRHAMCVAQHAVALSLAMQGQRMGMTRELRSKALRDVLTVIP